MSGVRRCLRLAVALAVQLAALSWAAAQEPSVSASLQPNSGITDTTPVQLTIEIVGGQNAQITPPVLGRLTNLSVLSGPNTNSSFSWVNGRTSASYQIRYTLLPGGPGEAVIPPLTLQVDSRTRPRSAISRSQRCRFADAPDSARQASVPSATTRAVDRAPF